MNSMSTRGLMCKILKMPGEYRSGHVCRFWERSRKRAQYFLRAINHLKSMKNSIFAYN